jgi:phytanoyl-CoA hydroxylase
MAGLTQAQVAQFNREGYLVVEGLFEPARDIDPVIAEYEGVLDTLAAELFAQGQIPSTYAGLPFGPRLIEIYKASGKVHAQYFDFSLHGANVTEDTQFWVGPAVFAMLRNVRLLDAVESIIGPELYSNPVQHVRLKPPEQYTPRDAEGRLQLGKTPPHQDNGVVLPEADQTEMLTVWFPLWDATIENGCLVVWPFSHQQGLLDHCPRFDGLQIPAQLLPGDPRPLPMKRGDALFMHRLTMHASLPNLSGDVRWSFDLRYNPTDQPSGRSAFPGFVARSVAAPWTELHDPVAWTDMWLEARARVSGATMPAFNRWDRSAVTCA